MMNRKHPPIIQEPGRPLSITVLTSSPVVEVGTRYSLLGLGDLDSSDWEKLFSEVSSKLATGIMPNSNSSNPADWVVRARMITALRAIDELSEVL